MTLNKLLYSQMFVNRIKTHLNLPNTFRRSFSADKKWIGHCLPPYVDPVYSYAFGRSQSHPIYRTLGQLLDESAADFPNKKSVISCHQKISKTYSELNEDADNLSKVLISQKIGLKRGDVAGLWSSNIYEFFVVQYALAKIGAVNCSMSPLFKSGGLEYVLSKGKIKTIFVPSKSSPQNMTVNNFRKVLDGVKYESTSLENIIYVESSHDKIDSNDTFNNRQLKTHDCNQLMSSDHLKNIPKVPQDLLEDVTPDDTCNIFFTSGTTGKPKGASSSQFCMINNCFFGFGSQRRIEYKNERIICLSLPLFHGFAGQAGVYSMAVVPTTFVLPDYRYSAAKMVEAIIEHQCTDLWLVPAMIIDIMNYIKTKNIPQKDIDCVKTIIAGAAPVPIEVVREINKVIPSVQTIIVAYGATETGPIATHPYHEYGPTVATETVGSPLDFTEAKIINTATGNIVKHDETGEILVRGHNVMKFYWDEPEKTKEVLVDGWYKTGDLATMDSKGNVRIVGRTKELIIRGGANVYPREVEELLHEHPNVLTVAVCGVPHERLGEQVCAWIKLKDESETMTLEDVKAFCKDKISYYKIPEHVLVVNDFPMTPSGKFQKFRMTEMSIDLLNLKK